LRAPGGLDDGGEDPMTDRAEVPPTYLDGLGRRLDLDTCAQEPIHIPGAVQPFGALVVLGEDDLLIRQVSANAERYLGVPPERALGRPISEFMRAGEDRLLARQLLSAAGNASLPLRLVFGETPLDVTLHRQARLILLELEPEHQEASGAFYGDVRRAIALLQ